MSPTLRVTLTGTGTSAGVPVIGCDCEVCTSEDPRNRRLRTAAKIELEDGVILIDTPTDLRQQALRYGIERLDAVLFTHSHADHIMGLDEVRIFNFRQRQRIPCYGSASTLAAIRRSFHYAFEGEAEGGGIPRLDLVPVDGPFRALGVEVMPLPAHHGSMPVTGYRIGDFAYLTDCNGIPEATMGSMRGLDVLVLGALRYRSHPTHFTVEEALTVAARIGAERTIFTHLAHEVDHAAPAVELPDSVELGYDGLSFTVP